MPTRTEHRRFRTAAFVACAALALAVGPGLAAAQEAYTLRPGDTLELAIAGAPEGSATALIGPDGIANLGFLGPLDVGGLPLNEARGVAQSAAERQPLRRYTETGAIAVVAIRPEDVRLGIAAYRPVRIGGLVVNPGRYAFEPGLTARGLIAEAGGIQTLAGLAAGGLSVQDLIRYRSDLDEAALASARAVIDIWSLSARLAETPDLERPAIAGGVLSEAERDRLWSEAEELVQTDLATASEERSFVRESLGQARERLDILTRQREELSGLLAADEEEEDRVQELISRGVAPASRLIEIRRASALSATRLLEVEESLSEARLEVIQLERRQGEIEQQRRLELLDDLEDARGRHIEAGLALGAGAALLPGTQGGPDPRAPAGTPEVDVVAYRSMGDQIEPVSIGLDEVLRPGDLLEIRHADPTAQTGE